MFFIELSILYNDEAVMHNLALKANGLTMPLMSSFVGNLGKNLARKTSGEIFFMANACVCVWMTNLGMG